VSARHVDERDDRQPEPLGELHRPHRLAVALGVGHAEVAPDVLVRVGALLLADDDDPSTVEAREPDDHGGVVAEQPVAMELDEVVRDRVDELERSRPAEVARELDPCPDRLARVGQLPRVDRAAVRRRAVAVALAGCQDRRRARRSSSGRRAAGNRSLRLPLASRRWQRGIGTHRQEPEELGQLRAHLAAGDDAIDEAVAEQELGPLEALGQLLGDRAGRHARPANPMSAFGSATLTSPTEANDANTPTRRGIGQHGEVRDAGGPQPLERRERLRQLHEGERPSCIRAPPDALTTMSGMRSTSASSAARVTFSPTTAPIEPPMKPKSMTQIATRVPPIEPRPQTAASRMPVAVCAATSRSGYGFWSTNPSASTDWSPASRSDQVPGSSSSSSLASAESRKWWPQFDRRASPCRAAC
jgi:hypothetical protein